MQTITKYFFIVICSLYVYRKLLNITIRKKLYLLDIPFAILSSVIAYFVYSKITPLTLISVFLLTTIYTLIVYKKSLNTTFSFSIISVGINYIFFLISLVITSPINYYLFLNIDNYFLSAIINSLIFGTLQFIIVFLFFRVRRFKNGIPYLGEQSFSNIGIFISIFLLLMASIYYTNNDYLAILTILIFLIIFCGVILILWWRSLITNSYLEKLHKREHERYEEIINEQQQQIDNIKLHNAELSKIIHKDNKLIPAMELAVKEFLATSSETELTDKADSLITQLSALSSERKGILNKYETTGKALPETGVPSIDAILKYLLLRANEANIHFDLSVTGNIKYMVSNIITENDLNTLISDLGENALIASKETEKGSVLITLGIDEENYCLNIYDNAPHFDTNVIRNLGNVRYTTHAETGGSGIGLMTTFELLRKYNASFEIDEYTDHELFTKSVTVRFDNNAKLRIRSTREEVAEVFTEKTALAGEANVYVNGYFEMRIGSET